MSERSPAGILPWFAQAQVDKLIEKARNDDVRDAIRVATATGVRRGELFGLR
jgi:hypothetical protein